jgi:hypothetical protein
MAQSQCEKLHFTSLEIAYYITRFPGLTATGVSHFCLQLTAAGCNYGPQQGHVPVFWSPAAGCTLGPANDLSFLILEVDQYARPIKARNPLRNPLPE